MQRHKLFKMIPMLALVGCSSVPGIGTQGTEGPPGLIMLNPPFDARTAANDEVVVKYRPGHRATQGMNYRTMALANTVVVKVPDSQTVPEMVAKLKADPNVEIAEPNYKYRAYATPNDPMFGQLWGIKKIGAPTVWDTSYGDSNLIVAVVDSGVDYNHEDLKGKVIKGPDTANNDSDPMDDVGHGTHVAGTIAGIGNNSKGVIGIAPNVKILGIKALGANGEGDVSTIADGIIKAQQLGAKVINLSLGGPQTSNVMKNAIDQVTAKGVLVIAAAGNENTTAASYPAAYPNVLAVGATDQNDKRTSFSNYGTYVDIAAPGLNIMSSTEGTYKSQSGTSMACPHVVGAAAMLLSKNPALTADQVRQTLLNNTDPATGFNSGVSRLNLLKAFNAISGGQNTGGGDGGGGTTPAPDTQAPSVPSGLTVNPGSNTVQLAWQPSTDNTGVAGYRVFRNGTAVGTTDQTSYTDSGLTANTTYQYSVVAYDAVGNASASSQSVSATTITSTTNAISNVVLTSVTRNEAVISWSTSSPSTSFIQYTPSYYYRNGYWWVAKDDTMVTRHQLKLSNLQSGTVYYLRIKSKDASGTELTSGYYGFQTKF